MTDVNKQSEVAGRKEETSSSSRFWALPWWGWTVALFGGLMFLGSVSSAYILLGENPEEGDAISTLIGVTNIFVMLAMLFCSGVAALKLVLMRVVGVAMPPSPRKPWMKIGGVLFVSGILLFLVPFLTVSARNSAQSNAPAEELKNVPAEELKDVRHSFGDGKFSLVVPETWEVMDDPALTSSDLFLSDQWNDLHLFAGATPLEDVAVTSVEEVLQHWVATTSAAMTNPVPGETRITLREGEAFADTTLEGTTEGMNLVYRSRVIKTQTHWVEIRLWTIRSRYSVNSELFEEIVASIQPVE